MVSTEEGLLWQHLQLWVWRDRKKGVDEGKGVIDGGTWLWFRVRMTSGLRVTQTIKLDAFNVFYCTFWKQVSLWSRTCPISVPVCVSDCRTHSTDQMAPEWLRNQYLSGKHGNNASACVCCTLVIKYWLSGVMYFSLFIFFIELQEWSVAVKSRIGGLPGACSGGDGGSFVSDVNPVEPRGCLSWNPATNSRCQNVSLAVAVTSVWASRIRRTETQKERCLAQLFSGHFPPTHPPHPSFCPA